MLDLYILSAANECFYLREHTKHAQWQPETCYQAQTSGSSLEENSTEFPRIEDAEREQEQHAC